MSVDLTRLMSDWPYEPGKLNVRLITGDDGEPRIQVRLDLGILQMHTEGRPDGQKPNGFDSLLEYHEARLDEAAAAGPPAAEKMKLTEDECEELRSEAVQYYHRYMALLVLEDYEGVIRDTTRNLRVLDLCAQHAETEGDREALEQVRPYITRMRARAMAGQALKENEPKAALNAIDDALESLRQYFAENGEPDLFE